MGIRQTTNDNEDLALVVGLGLFALVLLLYYFTETRNADLASLEEARKIIERYLTYFCFVISSAIFNALFFIAILGRCFGYKKQGSRLSSLVGKSGLLSRRELKRWSYSTILGMGFSCLLGSLAPLGLVESLTKIVAAESIIAIEGIIAFCFGLSVTIVTAIISRMKVWKILAHGSADTLPEYPRKENTIVLGSFGELQSSQQ